MYLCMVKECHISRALTTNLRAPKGPGGGESSPHSSSAPPETSTLLPLQLEPWRVITAGTDTSVCGPPPGSLGCLPDPCMVQGHYGVPPPPPAIPSQWEQWPRCDAPCPCSLGTPTCPCATMMSTCPRTVVMPPCASTAVTPVCPYARVMPACPHTAVTPMCPCTTGTPTCPPTSVPCFSKFWNWDQNSRRRIHLSFSGSVSPGSSDPCAKADVRRGACHQPSPASLTATSLAIGQLPPLQKMPQALVGGASSRGASLPPSPARSPQLCPSRCLSLPDSTPGPLCQRMLCQWFSMLT